MKAVGYLLNTDRGQEGEPGLFYDYILAGNGLFVRAKNSLLRATIRIAPTEVRGLSPLGEGVVLPGGRIPWRLLDLALSALTATWSKERYLAITWDDGYRLKEPPQQSSGAGVRYHRLPATIVDIHSHGAMRAFFSSIDDRDEQGLGIYMVVGKLNTLEPEVLLRVGIYGYFSSLRVEDIFDSDAQAR